MRYQLSHTNCNSRLIHAIVALQKISVGHLTIGACLLVMIMTIPIQAKSNDVNTASITTDDYVVIEVEYRDGTVTTITSPKDGVASGRLVSLRIRGVNRYANVLSISAQSGELIYSPLNLTEISDFGKLQSTKSDAIQLIERIEYAKKHVDVTYSTAAPVLERHQVRPQHAAFLREKIDPLKDELNRTEEYYSKLFEGVVRNIELGILFQSHITSQSIDERVVKLLDDLDKYTKVVDERNIDSAEKVRQKRQGLEYKITAARDEAIGALRKKISEQEVRYNALLETEENVNRLVAYVIARYREMMELADRQRRRIRYLFELKGLLENSLSESILRRHVSELDRRYGMSDASSFLYEDIVGMMHQIVTDVNIKIIETSSDDKDALNQLKNIQSALIELSGVASETHQNAVIQDILLCRSIARSPELFLVSSAPVQAQGSYIEFGISNAPREGTAATRLAAAGVKNTYRVPVTHTFRGIVSGGVATILSAKDEYFKVRTSDGMDSIVKSNENGLYPPFVSFCYSVYYDADWWRHFAFTMSLGIAPTDVSTAQLFMGLSIRTTGTTSLVISAGVGVSQMDMLNSRYQVDQSYDPNIFADTPLMVKGVAAKWQLVVSVSLL